MMSSSVKVWIYLSQREGSEEVAPRRLSLCWPALINNSDWSLIRVIAPPSSSSAGAAQSFGLSRGAGLSSAPHLCSLWMSLLPHPHLDQSERFSAPEDAAAGWTVPAAPAGPGPPGPGRVQLWGPVWVCHQDQEVQGPGLLWVWYTLSWLHYPVKVVRAAY